MWLERKTMNSQRIAVIGSGISGLSAAWLLSKAHSVTLYEENDRIGGHSNTVDLKLKDGVVPVDTGFIVYNEKNYPNLTSMFDHLNVATDASEMTFAMSLKGGGYEYSGTGANGFFGQRRNIFSSSHWKMLGDIVRFFRTAQRRLTNYPLETTLGHFLTHERFSTKFVDEHIVPMGAAIWSTDVGEMLKYPAKSFVDFYANHNLLKVISRPNWRTVQGGSRSYVDAILKDSNLEVLQGQGVTSVRRQANRVDIEDSRGTVRPFDQVVFAGHADQMLKTLKDPSEDEADLLSKFEYQRNVAVVHSDPKFMPQRKRIWSSWNYFKRSAGNDEELCVTYWMNALQNLNTSEDVFVTLNPSEDVAEDRTHMTIDYDHPVFDANAHAAQRNLNLIQGVNRSWYCGSYFGHGFHEDGIQSGLDVAERLGGVQRPWDFDRSQSRIPSNRDHVMLAAE